MIPMPCSVTGCKRECSTTLADQFPATKELGSWYRCDCPEHGFDGYVSQKHWTYYVQAKQDAENAKQKKLERAKKAAK